MPPTPPSLFGKALDRGLAAILLGLVLMTPLLLLGLPVVGVRALFATTWGSACTATLLPLALGVGGAVGSATLFPDGTPARRTGARRLAGIAALSLPPLVLWQVGGHDLVRAAVIAAVGAVASRTGSRLLLRGMNWLMDGWEWVPAPGALRRG